MSGFRKEATAANMFMKPSSYIATTVNTLNNVFENQSPIASLPTMAVDY
jgi:hypothetical protein